MSVHERFGFRTLDELKQKISQLGINISLSEHFDVFHRTVPISGNFVVPNSISTLPMEGCDCKPDGGPSDLFTRRYRRLVGGGAGLIWWEACAVIEEGRANPLQMMLTEKNLPEYVALLRDLKIHGNNTNGYKPIHILQLTHSGRFSRPYDNKYRPLIAQNDPILDPLSGVDQSVQPVSDMYLDSLIEDYVKCSKLAQQAGFDGVDVKACHRYLVNELLASTQRDGRYGGGFENRIRFLLSVICAIKAELGDDFIVACRFNVFDAQPYPYGFGVGKDDLWTFDDTEPLLLVKKLCQDGIQLLSNSAGNPYYIYPQVTRPFDYSSKGIPVPNEHPLESIARLFDFSRRIQMAAGEVPVVGNGYSWLRQFAPYAGAANIENKSCTLMGLGRSSFAYPNAPRDILLNGKMDAEKCCIACSKCTQLMRDSSVTGCVVKDTEIYVPFYKQIMGSK